MICEIAQSQAFGSDPWKREKDGLYIHRSLSLEQIVNFLAQQEKREKEEASTPTRYTIYLGIFHAHLVKPTPKQGHAA